MGKKPRLATRLKVLTDKEQALELAERTVNCYRKHGRKKERFGHTIDRIGEDIILKEILDGI